MKRLTRLVGGILAVLAVLGGLAFFVAAAVMQ